MMKANNYFARESFKGKKKRKKEAWGEHLQSRLSSSVKSLLIQIYINEYIYVKYTPTTQCRAQL